MKIAEKLDVLSRIANAFNRENLTWAIGGSLLLYFKGITENFRDIDIMVSEADVTKAKQILLSLGTLHPANPNPNPQYRTKTFLEFTIDDVEIDVMAGFTIIAEEKEYYLPLHRESVKDQIITHGERIPLQALAVWRSFYQLMGRNEKVNMIDAASMPDAREL